MKGDMKEEMYKKELQYERKLRKKEEEQNEMLKKDKEYYKSMLAVAGQIVKKSMNAFTYISEHYPDAPVIEALTIDDFRRGVKMIKDIKITGVPNIKSDEENDGKDR